MGRIARALVVLAVLTGILGVPLPGSQATTAAERRAELLIIHLVNRDRPSYGAGALLENGGLRTGAESHSVWLAANRYGTPAFNGKDPHDGFSTRYANFQTASNPGTGGMCENVAMVAGTIYSTYKRAATKLYKLWVHALDGHNQCLYDKPIPPSNIQLHTSVVGVGVTKRGNHWYATYDAGEDSSPNP